MKGNSSKKASITGKRHANKRKTRSKGRKTGKRKARRINISIWVVAAVLTALAALIAMPYLKEKPQSYKGAKVPEGYHCYGIDVSRYQPRIEWDSLKVLTDGQYRTIRSATRAKDIRNVSFAFIKATEGNSLKDRHFNKHWKNAGKAGIRRGAYHFFRSSKDAEEQALHFINTVGDLSENDLPPVLDIETIHNGCSRKTLNDRALKWLNIIEKHYGRKPIVYSPASFIRHNLCDEIKENYTIWVAHYGTPEPDCDLWHIWQFADNAIVYGIDGEVDLNVTTSEILNKL